LEEWNTGIMGLRKWDIGIFTKFLLPAKPTKDYCFFDINIPTFPGPDLASME